MKRVSERACASLGGHRKTAVPYRGRVVRLMLAAAAGGVACLGLGGCETDSFLDPSVIGRWEHTPTTMPILTRLASIEDEAIDVVETSPITPADLIPEAEEYRFATGDQLQVIIRDFFNIGQDEPFDLTIDPRGNVDIPRLPTIRAEGKTTSEFIKAVEDAIRERRINDRAVVLVNVRSQRKQTYSVMGSVASPGSYFIPASDLRLLQGLTTAGGVSEVIPKIFVIRQIPLTDEAAGFVPEPPPVDPDAEPAPGANGAGGDAARPKQGKELIDLIDELSKPKPPGGSPGAMGSSGGALAGSPAANRSNRMDLAPSRMQPPIDLPDPAKSAAAAEPTPAPVKSDWIYLNGQWVRSGGVTPGIAGTSATDARPGAGEGLVAQRVIEIPTDKLLAGVADVNIIIRPGDVVRVPQPESGLVYMGGFISRSGPYSLPIDGKLTLLRAIDAAGGINPLAIPERVDLTRMLGGDRQATIRLNLRAIAEQTQPDIYLKPDDRINIGSNFWAFPLFVLRGGLRMSYGYGFVLDRNFGGDIFGVDPSLSR